MKTKVTLVAALIVSSTVAVVAEPELKFPNRYNYELALFPRAPSTEYFYCDYTARTCLRGYAYRGRFIGQRISDADRTTVLAHISCAGGRCTNYDTGEISDNSGLIGILKEDLPRHCVDDFVNRGEPCDLSVVPVGSKWGLHGNVVRCKERPATAFDMRGCQTGVDEIVVVDKVDNYKACVRPVSNPEGTDCSWVNKSNLATLR